MATNVKIGAPVRILIDETIILEAIATYLNNCLREDIELLEGRKRALSALIGRTARVAVEGPVHAMKLYFLEFIRADIEIRQRGIEHMTERISQAFGHKPSKDSQQALQEAIMRFKEADMYHEAAENKVKEDTDKMYLLHSSYKCSNKDVTLPLQDLDYRRRTVDLNCRKEEMSILCYPLDPSHDDKSLLNTHQAFIELVKSATLTYAYETSNLNSSLVTKTAILIDSIPKVQAFVSIGRISDLREGEQHRPEFQSVEYRNPFTNSLVKSPIWGIPNVSFVDSEGNITDLRLWLAKYYIKRCLVLMKNEDLTEQDLGPTMVVPLAFNLEANFSCKSLEAALGDLRLEDAKRFLEFVLSNQPTPVLELDDATFERFKSGWASRLDTSLFGNRPSLIAALSRQPDENKIILQFLCEKSMWDEDLSLAVTHRKGAKTILIDISRKWDFDQKRLKRTR